MAAARLVRLNHPPAAVLHYTPRQVAAWLAAGMELERQDRATGFALSALAAQGEGKAIKRQIEELEKE